MLTRWNGLNEVAMAAALLYFACTSSNTAINNIQRTVSSRGDDDPDYMGVLPGAQVTNGECKNDGFDRNRMGYLSVFYAGDANYGSSVYASTKLIPFRLNFGAYAASFPAKSFSSSE
jgi:hypothetical protein